MENKLYTISDYAKKQGCSKQAVYKKVNSGKLKTVEVLENGKKIKYIQVDPETEELNQECFKFNQPEGKVENNDNKGAVEKIEIQPSETALEKVERLKQLNNRLNDERLKMVEIVETQNRIIEEKDKKLMEQSETIADLAKQLAEIAKAATEANKPKKHWWQRIFDNT